MRAETIYAWFKLYRNDLKYATAQWDILNFIRQDIPLDPKDETFFQLYAKVHKIAINANQEKK